MVSFFNRLIAWSFYALFFIVPIIFAGSTSELFEFNKMWLTFGLTLVIATSWASKILIEKRISLFKTPLNLFILLFLVSQVLATIFSIDPYTSIWGYYSRFNSGLLSLISYAFLFFAFVNTIPRKDVMKFIYTGIASAVFVSLWGLPSHFGYDPTCLMFRGTLDVSCWTFAFQPMVRIFSTLGQPDWLAAYLAYMLPLAVAFSLIFWKAKNKFLAFLFFIFTSLFFVDLLFTKSRSGIAGFFLSIALFAVCYVIFEWRSFAKHPLLKSLKAHGIFLATLGLFFLFTFLIGSSFSQLDKFSLSGLQTLFAEKNAVTHALQTKQIVTPTPPPAIPVEEIGGTDSSKIRLFVWEGALQVFLHYPLFGTGVETFAYSYYLYRPAGHNLTSEWDYLYNKAHNEYLNYLATTGIVGFGTYMALVIASLWLMAWCLWQTRDMQFEQKDSIFLSQPYAIRYMLLAMLTSYVSILITNFFGFSVVIMNIYLFLTPAFALFLLNTISEKHAYVLGKSDSRSSVSELSWIAVGILWLICFYFLFVLLQFWLADINYGMGQNLDNVQQYQAAYSYLHDAVATRPSEPTFQNELSINDAVLAAAFYQQKDTADGNKLRDEAIFVSDSLVKNHPAVVTYWKSRVRIFYSLATIQPHYLTNALSAIQVTSTLAPTDAKVWYNLGLLEDQTGHINEAITVMQRTIQLKGDYRDAYYALALFYRQAAVGSTTSKKVVDTQMEQKAVSEMHFILANFGPNDDLKIKETLASWGEK